MIFREVTLNGKSLFVAVKPQGESSEITKMIMKEGYTFLCEDPIKEYGKGNDCYAVIVGSKKILRNGELIGEMKDLVMTNHYMEVIPEEQAFVKVKKEVSELMFDVLLGIIVPSECPPHCTCSSPICCYCKELKI